MLEIDWSYAIDAIIESAKKSRRIYKWFRPTTFLNYDLRFLLENYRAVRPIAPDVPYTETVRWLGTSRTETLKASSSIAVIDVGQEFELVSPTSGLRQFRIEAEKALTDAGKMTSDSHIVRLKQVDVSAERTTLYVQHARYHHQAGSNLVLDWVGEHSLSSKDGAATLRKYFNANTGDKLPDLADARLANTTGIAVILLYRSGNELIPYLPRRVGTKISDLLRSTGRTSKKLAVFEGGYHCTASGAAEWEDNAGSFDKLIVEDMYRELDEEVGITKEDVTVMVPVALCREFLRAGKPQIFFVGITKLDIDTIAERHKKAIERALRLDVPPEVHDDARPFSNGQELLRQIDTQGLTLEVLANLQYVDEFRRQFG